MARVRLTALLVVLWLQAPAGAAGPPGDMGDEPVTIGVMELVAKGGITQEKVDVLLDVLAGEISSLGSVKVVTLADIRAMLDLEKLRRLAGCSDEECFAEISGALGMRWVVTGNVSRFGGTFLVNLKLMDVRGVVVVGRVVRKVRGGAEDLLECIPEAVHALFEGVADRLGLDVQQRVTVAARHAQPLSQSPSAVFLITRDDIEASGADSIPNLLRLVPGMEVVLSSAAFHSIASRLQWTTEGNHHLVLIDGREANFDPLGFAVWEAEPIFLEDMERIEVIRGPASVLYGANAFAGVVSITTREIPGRTSAGILTRMGEAGRTTAGFRASSNLSGWGLAVNGGFDLAGEFTDPRLSSKRFWKIRVRAERRWAESNRLLVDMGTTYGGGPFASPLGILDSSGWRNSIRLAYESEGLRGQLYWIYWPVELRMDTPIEYAGVRLANFVPAPLENHVVDAQLQWTPPRFFEPLLIITGGGVRTTLVSTDQGLDAETFVDPTSPRYHKPGISRWEVRGGVFVHAEYALADWVTVTGGTRVDYDTQTGWFVSPRLAAVFEVAADHYLRLGMARSFRKPSFIETIGHLTVEFPDDSPIQGTAQERFLEFMTRVGGNRNLVNEELLAFEAGYMSRFLEGRLNCSLDLYYNRYRNMIVAVPDVIEDDLGLPNLNSSSFMFHNTGPDLDVMGAEFSVRFSPTANISLLASWTHRQVYDYSIGQFSRENPKNLITLGGRFRTDWGLLGSLYAFARSDFWDTTVENPAGILQPLQHQHLDNVILLIGRLGRRFELGRHGQLEAGVKLFLPVSPFAAPHFRYYEAGGGITPDGRQYGAEQLGRVLSGYLEGAF